MFRTLFLLPLFLLLLGNSALAADRDRDGIDDAFDNCLWDVNPEQIDSDRDGYGNRCDADLNNDGRVTVTDFPLFVNVFGSFSADADFDGDNYVSTTDFGRFLELFGSAVGPGAVLEEREPIVCRGGFCTLFVAPGIELDVEQAQFVANADGTYAVSGDAEIFTPEGGVLLGDVDLVVDPGVGMTGTSLEPDYSIGILEGSPTAIIPNRVAVTTAPGRELDLEIPLYDDVQYVVFSDGGLLGADFETRLGEFVWSVSSASWRLVLDPVDPFVYVASDVVLPILTARNLWGVDFTEVGYGLGISLGGRIPFAPDAPMAIEAVLPEIQGDSIYYASFDPSAFVPLVSTRIEGVVITDEDPDENGALLFGGSSASSRDFRRVVDGTISVDFGIGILPSLAFDVDVETGLESVPVTLISSFTGVGTPNEKRESWFSLDLDDYQPIEDAANDWITLTADKNATVFYFSDDPNENYFRAAIERTIEIDSQLMAAVNGVEADVLRVDSSYLQIDRRQVELVSESYASSIHPDVVFTAESRIQLVLPTSDESAFDLSVETESVIGGVSLRQYGQRLTVDAFSHWGRFETPNYGYQLAGAFTDEGAWLEGSASTRLPYRYAPVALAADLAGRIAEEEAAREFAERDFDVNTEQLAAYRNAYASAAAELSTARSALSTARSYLAERRRALENREDHSCGTCKWYDAVCWAEVGTCNAWKTATIPGLRTLVETAEIGVSLAQATVNRVQRLADEAAVLVAGAERAVELANAARDEARLALIALRAERASLPLEDGEIDATVALRLTRDGLVGTVSGTFQGVDFGTGQVVNDADGPRACFTVPQTGEALCADL